MHERVLVNDEVALSAKSQRGRRVKVDGFVQKGDRKVARSYVLRHALRRVARILGNRLDMTRTALVGEERAIFFAVGSEITHSVSMNAGQDLTLQG